MQKAIAACVLAGAEHRVAVVRSLADAGEDAPAGTATAQRPARSARGAAKPTATFESLAAQASAAREANDLEKAIPLYEQAVKLRPTWTEGYWYLGTSNYELDRFEASRDAFRRVTRIDARQRRRVGIPGPLRLPAEEL